MKKLIRKQCSVNNVICCACILWAKNVFYLHKLEMRVMTGDIENWNQSRATFDFKTDFLRSSGFKRMNNVIDAAMHFSWAIFVKWSNILNMRKKLNERTRAMVTFFVGCTIPYLDIVDIASTT